LKQSITREKLRDAICDGSIATFVVWQPVNARDTISVPAGTIHAIGAGLVVAEIQQRSDTTFRLFDHGSNRALHLDDATAMADLGIAQSQQRCERLSPERTLLVANSYFIFERVSLRPDTTWQLEAMRETWLLVLEGNARAGSLDLRQGEAIFAQHERVAIGVGQTGLDCLVAYTGCGGPAAQLLTRSQPSHRDDTSHTGTQPSPTIPIGAAL
jgi:mannose-6-phosphate isomerase